VPQSGREPSAFSLQPSTSKWSLWTGCTKLRGVNFYQCRGYPDLDGTEFMCPGPVGPPYTQADFDGLAATRADYANISHPGLCRRAALCPRRRYPGQSRQSGSHGYPGCPVCGDHLSHRTKLQRVLGLLGRGHDQRSRRRLVPLQLLQRPRFGATGPPRMPGWRCGATLPRAATTLSSPATS